MDYFYQTRNQRGGEAERARRKENARLNRHRNNGTDPYQKVKS